ncbi:MAG: 4Fe-4S dicluster domain-containing protein [Deltaproteobacteria bacterium]|nr:4Fe-4S dicluster domain-containing protein [Deltaproteobacteria bacterium]
MSRGEHIHKLAEWSGKGESPGMQKILECAMTDEEARFLLDLPAAPADLAAKYGMDEKGIEEKLLDLARRGLVVTSRKGIRFPRNPSTLHDNILASAEAYVPHEMGKLWMDLYDGEGWAEEIGHGLVSFGVTALRTIPAQGCVPSETRLLPYESIEAIIEANKNLISMRHCCCRRGAKKCEHPTEVCIQFGRRAEYDLYRGSGRKISTTEAIEAALEAAESGLVPTVTNMSSMQALEFICFCCGCCCLVLDPAARVGGTDKILAPSRFEAKVDNNKCDGCKKCPMRCAFDAIEMQDLPGYAEPRAVIDSVKCVGCGACVPKCPIEGALTLELVRPPEFIPETLTGPSSVLHM